MSWIERLPRQNEETKVPPIPLTVSDSPTTHTNTIFSDRGTRIKICQT